MKIVVCIPGFFGGNSNITPNYGGAGYEEGLIARLRSASENFDLSLLKPLDVLWSNDFVDTNGVYRRALRDATPNEIEAYKNGIRNISLIDKKFTISFVADGKSDKIEIFNSSKENATAVLKKMLFTDNKNLDEINYILEE